MTCEWLQALKDCPEARVPTIRSATRYSETLLDDGWRGDALLLVTQSRFHREELTENETRGAIAIAWFSLRFAQPSREAT